MKLLIQLANHIMRLYWNTPAPLRWVWYAIPILYIVIKIDLIPDMAGLFGRIDDLVFGLFFFWALDRARKYGHFWSSARKADQQKQGSQETQQDTFEGRTPHQVLEVPENADRATLKKAYRAQIAKYHPDKFSHLGPIFEETAKKQTQAIIAAYDALK